MMKKAVILLAFIILGTCGIQGVHAQKYGHLNFGNILELMPETKKANDSLFALRTKLVTEHEANLKKFQSDYAEAQRKLSEGTMSRIKAEEKSKQLQARQQKLIQREQEISTQIQKKRDELLQPILDKLKTVIDQIGKEEGFTMIFDISSGAFLFADASQDLTQKVKAKLGIKSQ